MLTKDELQELTRTSGFKLHQEEKSYIQMIALYHIYKKISRELVFKGGTALQKVYGLNRFSEDLDFTKNEEVDLDALMEHTVIGLRNYGVDCEIKKERTRFEFSDKYKISAKGPLFSGEVSRVFVRVEISGREKTILEPEIHNIFPIYRDVPNFSLAVMPLKEVAAEKVRAIFSRDKPRDVYDLWFLLNKGVEIDHDFIAKKLGIGDLKYSYEEFSEKLEGSGKSWEADLRLLINEVPSFPQVKLFILDKFRQ